jgi:hypothetical protein
VILSKKEKYGKLTEAQRDKMFFEMRREMKHRRQTRINLVKNINPYQRKLLQKNYEVQKVLQATTILGLKNKPFNEKQFAVICAQINRDAVTDLICKSQYSHLMEGTEKQMLVNHKSSLCFTCKINGNVKLKSIMARLYNLEQFIRSQLDNLDPGLFSKH